MSQVSQVSQVREMLIREIAEWIETEPLAEAITDTLEEQEAEVTLENAQKLWLDFLETGLHSGICYSLAALVDKGEIKSEWIHGKEVMNNGVHNHPCQEG